MRSSWSSRAMNSGARRREDLSAVWVIVQSSGSLCVPFALETKESTAVARNRVGPRAAFTHGFKAVGFFLVEFFGAEAADEDDVEDVAPLLGVRVGDRGGEGVFGGGGGGD